MKHLNLPDVGAPDPELKNSPIYDYELEESDDINFETEGGVCFFNGKRYRAGEYICSGSELLHCEQGGVWVRKGSCYE